jgi:hypothetical protein
MNLVGLGAGMGIALPEATQRWLQIQQQREALAQAARQRQSADALIASLTTPDVAALPQQGAPGIASMQSPTPSSPTIAADSPAPASAMAPSPAVGSAPASAPVATPSTPTGGFGIGMPQPLKMLASIVRQLKAANPGVDNLTLLDAASKEIELMKGVAPEDRQLMQAQIALLNAQQRYYSTNVRSADTRRGQDIARDTRMAVVGMQQEGANARAKQKIDAAMALAAQGGTLSDDDAKMLGEAWAKGDRTVTAGLGWGKTGSANRAKVLAEAVKYIKAQGGSGADIAAARAEFMGTQSAERTAGTRSANLGIALEEAKQFAPMVIAASQQVNRTQFPSLNALLQAAQRGTGGEAVLRLYIAVNAFKNAYAQAVTRGGQSTDDARRRADEVLNAAWSKGQISTAIDQLIKEMQAAQAAPAAVRADLRQSITGQPAPDVAGPPPAPPQPGEVQDGYRFKGGNPADPNAWEQVQ